VKLAKKRIALLRSIETLEDVRLMDMTPSDDELSHFACRLLCCNIPWAFTWFIAAEIKLFRARVKNVVLSEVKNYFYTVLLERMKNLKLEDGFYHLNQDASFDDDILIENQVSDTFGIKIHFTRVPNILRESYINFKQGYFVVQESNFRQILIAEYSDYLLRKMTDLKINQYIKSDDRFNNIAAEIFVEQKSTTSNQLSNILENSPFCIISIIEKLRKEKHLKYNDRQIFIRYLKGCGLAVNDCIEYFKTNFACDQTRFEREFVYAIRHNYGLEGKRADYHTFTCMQIIGMKACPFMFQPELSKMLESKGLPDLEDTLKEELKNRNFVKACTIVCEKTSKKENLPVVTSPVAYFKTSKKT
ncbi:Eukaryotic-type DNA primase, large subunit, partial [Pseudoloma neurophilia]